MCWQIRSSAQTGVDSPSHWGELIKKGYSDISKQPQTANSAQTTCRANQDSLPELAQKAGERTPGAQITGPILGKGRGPISLRCALRPAPCHCQLGYDTN